MLNLIVMDKSLDEIIKSKRTMGQNKRNVGGRGRTRARGGFQRSGYTAGGRGGTNLNSNTANRGRGKGLRGTAVRGQNRTGHLNSNSRVATFGPMQAVSIHDARDQLNLKARQTDARVKLIQKAHTVDARQKLQAKRRQSHEGAVIPHQQSPHQQQPHVQIQLDPSQMRVPSVTISNPQAKKRKSTDVVVQTESGIIQITRKQPVVTSKLAKKATPVKQRMDIKKMYITTSNDSVSSRMPAGSLKTATTASRLQHPMKIRKMVQETLPPAPPPPPQPPRQPATERLSPLGTRVFVTKLHYSVTEEDIKELFGAIGALRKARLVKQGIAEVVYVERECALEAINVYNNRELDGVPMQCKLDSTTVPETPAVKSTNRPISDRFKYTRTQSAGIESSGTMRADDVEAGLIHKALFKTASTSPGQSTKPVVFTVKI